MMLIIEIFEESPFAGVGFFLLVLLIIGICANCEGATSVQKEETEVTETETVVEDVANLTSLHVLGTHTPMLDNLENGPAQDAYGNTYPGPHFELCSYGNYVGEVDTEAFVDIVTGGHYQHLTGTYFCRPGQADEFTIEFFVFADNRLVYSSGTMTRRDKPVNFTVDIGNCDVLRIQSRSTNYTAYGTNPGIILVNATVD